MQAKNITIVCVLTSFVACVVITGILALVFGLGFGLGVYKQVSYEYYGLNYDTYKGTLEKNVYEEGLYNLGVSGQFILIPKIYKGIEFKGDTVLSGYSSDGINVKLDISYQYKVEKQHVIEIVNNFGKYYEDSLVKYSRNVFRDVMSHYKFDQFITNRLNISDNLSATLVTKVKTDFNITIFDVQLRAVSYPAELSGSFLANEQIKIQYQQAQSLREKSLFELESNILLAKKNTELELTKANTTIQINVLNANANNEILIIKTRGDNKANQEKAVSESEILLTKTFASNNASIYKSVADAISILNLAYANNNATIYKSIAESTSIFNVGSATNNVSLTAVDQLYQMKYKVGMNNSDIVNYSFANGITKNNGTFFWNLNPNTIKLV